MAFPFRRDRIVIEEESMVGRVSLAQTFGKRIRFNARDHGIQARQAGGQWHRNCKLGRFAVGTGADQRDAFEGGKSYDQSG